MRAIERQNTITQKIARDFSAFVEDDVDLPTFTARLAKQEAIRKPQSPKEALTTYWTSRRGRPGGCGKYHDECFVKFGRLCAREVML